MRRRELRRLAKDLSEEEYDRRDDELCNELLEGYVITLSQELYEECDQVAEARHRGAIAAGKLDSHGLRASFQQGLDYHKTGVYGEPAVCILLNVPWERRIDTYKSKPDIGIRTQVRTRDREGQDLQVRPGDKDHEIFVHVVRVSKYEFRVHGWLWGHEAKEVA